MYIDPGAFGTVSQIGSLLLFLIVSVYLFLRHRAVSLARRLRSAILGGSRTSSAETHEPGEEAHN